MSLDERNEKRNEKSEVTDESWKKKRKRKSEKYDLGAIIRNDTNGEMLDRNALIGISQCIDSSLDKGTAVRTSSK